MNLKFSLLDFLKITWKKIIITVLFPIIAFAILMFAFVFDELLGLGGSGIVNVMYSFANYFYLFILMPLTFVDIDFATSIVFKIAIMLTLVGWYFLSCVLIFLLKKAWEKKGLAKNQ